MRSSKADRQTTRALGKIDIDLFAELVGAAYEEADHDRRRTDRSLMLLCAELEQAHALLLEAFVLCQARFGKLRPETALKTIRFYGCASARLSRKSGGRNSLPQHLRAIGVSCAAGTFWG
jgi:hypothetical protein